MGSPLLVFIRRHKLITRKIAERERQIWRQRTVSRRAFSADTERTHSPVVRSHPDGSMLPGKRRFASF
jgi:hypothetical protein